MYATRQAMIDRYGEDELIQLTDRARTGEIDDAVLDQALADADAEIDGYLAARYTLPLAYTPDNLQRIACDIARYRLFAAKAPDEVRDRYKDAVSWLKDVSRGTARLDLPQEQAASAGVATLLFAGESRRCSRTTLEGF